MASVISAGLTTTTALVYTADTSGILQLQTNGGTTAVTIDTSQRVGIGTTSPGAKLEVSGVQTITGGSGVGSANGLHMWFNTGTNTAYIQGYQSGVDWRTIVYNGTQHIWQITDVEKMRLDNSGNLLVGQTSVSQTTVGFSVLGSGPSQGQVTSVQSGSTNATTTWNTYSTGAGAYRFYVDMGGTIHATSTSITAISDASLKTNIKPLETGLAEINRLQPRRFDWLDQGKNEGTNIAGFISQEVQEVLPDLTPNFKYNETETKLGLKMGDMIPTMVKAIQELSAKVTALEAKVGI